MEQRPSISAFYSNNPSGLLTVYARYQNRHYETMIQDSKALQAPPTKLDNKDCKDLIFKNVRNAGCIIEGSRMTLCMKGIYMDKEYHLHIVLQQKTTTLDTMATEIAMLRRQVTIQQNETQLLRNENQILRDDNQFLTIKNQAFKNEVNLLREREYNRKNGVKTVDMMDLTN